MRPNKLKCQNVEQTKAYYRAKQAEQVICVPQTPNPLKRFIKAILKARWGHGVPGSVINLCTILWLADGDQSLGFPTGSDGKESACNAGDLDLIPLEKGMATHSSILAWKIPWTEEPGGLQGLKE